MFKNFALLLALLSVSACSPQPVMGEGGKIVDHKPDYAWSGESTAPWIALIAALAVLRILGGSDDRGANPPPPP